MVTSIMARQFLCVLHVLYVIKSSHYVTSSTLDVNTVIIWSPSESRFFATATNKTLMSIAETSPDVTVLEDRRIFDYYTEEYQHLTTPWTVFVDLREYACPEEVFRERVLAYVSVTQLPCPSLSNSSRQTFVRVHTRTFDRGSLVAELTNTSHRTTSSLALLFDDSGEEYFFERSSGSQLPLVFEVTVALDRCAATEQLKNLTAKTEIRDVVVVARAACITDLLTEASLLQLMFGRYRWLLYPTDHQFPECQTCEKVNGVILMQENLPETLAVTRPEKVMLFVEESVRELERDMSPAEIDTCNNCSTDCHVCVESMRSAMEQVEGERTMVFFRDNETALDDIMFDLYIMSPNGSTKVGEWSKAGGVVDSNSDDLFPHSKGHIVLRAVVVVEPPFVFHEKTANGSVFTGYSLDVLKRISTIVGFSYVVRECDNNDYGTSQAPGEWSGCMGNVVRGEADVIVGALTVTAEREEVVDFTLPYYDFAGIQILMKEPDNKVSLFYFVDVFTTEAWLCLFGVIVLTSVLLFLFERFSPQGGKATGDGTEKEDASEEAEPRAFDLKESIWFVIGSVTLAGGGDPPRCLASRLLVAGFWFFSVVIMSTFTANLAAFLTVSRMGTTIASLDELAAQSDVKYSVVRDSNVMAYFEHQAAIERNFYELWKNMSLGSTKPANGAEQSLAVWDYPLGDKFGNMWNAMQATGLFNSTQDGLERVLSGDFALISESPVIKYLASHHCSLTAVGDQFSVRPYAFALKEKSLFTSKFTTAILTLQKQRELEDLKRKWWDEDKVECPAESRDQGLDLSSLNGTFIVMGGGLVLGMMVLGVEFLVSRRNPKGKKDLTPEKAREGNKVKAKAIATVETSHHTQNHATLEQMIMARELRRKMELHQTT
ncbi:ionotropic receptor 25a-like [Babylonia areolata]|uniref:ionotropic receptor 25a-like n=1 Tax=Babylonia areolata TaxID=304850 RepID=UPI003FD4B356